MSSNWETYKLADLCDIGSSKRIFQHEYDHLIGLAYIDRIKSNKDIISEEVYFKKIS